MTSHISRSVTPLLTIIKIITYLMSLWHKSIIKFTTKSKFEDKILVWIAMNLKGLVVNSKHRVSFEYLGSLLMGNDDIWTSAFAVISFERITVVQLQRCYYLFLSNLVSSHCSESFSTTSARKNITFIEKSDNPSYFPKFGQLGNSKGILIPKYMLNAENLIYPKMEGSNQV